MDVSQTTTTTDESSATEDTTQVQEGTAGGEAVGVGQDQGRNPVPFVLNFDQPIPPDFRAAYQRRTLIAVYFFETGSDPFFPQGLEVDRLVSGSMEELQGEYPTIEFFSYDIANPGNAQTSETLENGQYGTLAAQLGVGYTPFVATMAPSGDGYVILNRLQGYVSQPVLSQVLFDLSSIEVADNTSDIQVGVEAVELTGSGGGVEYFTVSNAGENPVDLQGFSLRVFDPETGEVTNDSPGVMVEDSLEAPPGESVAIGRVPDVTDADGNVVAGTFGGGQRLDLSEGDQVALLDSGGAVAATFSV
ncbi:MAG: lamin tail domain-containing protein [Actinomycetota bacterium]|nr:lamin tail domain-containing protein [Actinomycetota bacterium]